MFANTVTVACRDGVEIERALSRIREKFRPGVAAWAISSSSALYSRPGQARIVRRIRPAVLNVNISLAY